MRVGDTRRISALLSGVFIILALVAGTPVAVQPASSPPERLTVELARQVDTLPGDTPVPVIIRFGRPLEQVDWTQLEASAGGKVEASHRFAAIQAVAASVPAARVRGLVMSPQVWRVEYDSRASLAMNTATRWFGVAQARQDFGLDGSGITAAVVDTGIDASHQDLAGKVVGWFDIIAGNPAPYDDHGHGTHVSGIIAGTGAASGGMYAGVAPGAGLVGVKVLDSSGSGSISGIVTGVQWLIDNRTAYNIRIANLSLCAAGSSDGQDSLSSIVNAAADAGIVMVVAACNNGPTAWSIGAPAAAAKAITVGAMADPGEQGFSLADFSSRGPTADGRVKPDLAAPGVNISAPAANTGNQYRAMSGTSMASPFVAGVAALMLQATAGLTPVQIKQMLVSTTEDWGPLGPDNEYGAGRLDGYAAVQAARGTSGGIGPSVPNHRFFSGSLGGTGDQLSFSLTVGNTAFPLAATLIMPDWTGTAALDFTVDVIDPTGTLLGSSLWNARQDQLSLAPATQGTYTLRVRSLSGAGRFWLDASAGIDPAPYQPPVVQIVTPAPGTVVQQALTLGATVQSVAPTAKVTWSLDGGSASAMSFNSATGRWEARWDTRSASNGSHSVVIHAIDTNSQEGAASAVYTVNNPAPPQITIVSPTPGSIIQQTVTLSATIQTTGTLARVEWTVDNGTYGPMVYNSATGRWEAAWDTTSLPNGSHMATVRATDTVNQVSSAAALYTLKNGTSSAPQVQVVTPTPGSTVQQTVTLSATVQSSASASRVEWSLDGGPAAAMTYNGASGRWEAAWDTTTGANGTHSATVRAVDQNGLSGSASATYTVSNQVTQPPTVQIAAPAAGTTIRGDVTLAAIVTGPNSLASVTWSLDGGPSAAMTYNGVTGCWEALWPTTQVANGTYSVLVHALDSAGLTGDTTATLTVDNPPPAHWSSGNLEPQVWSVSGTPNSTSASQDYSYTPPAYSPVSMAVTLDVSAYTDAGSAGTDQVAPYIEVWTLSGGAEGQLVGTFHPSGTGVVAITSQAPAAMAATALRVKVVSLSRKSGKVVDRVSIDLVQVDLYY